MRLVPATLLALSLALVTGGQAAGALNMTQVGALLGGDFQEVDVEGTTAFVAAGTNLTVVDVSNTAAPRIVLTLPMPGPVRGVDVAGGILCLAVGENGVRIYDVSNPLAPGFLASYPFNAERVRREYERLYVCGGTAGLAVLDLTDPAAPQLISTYSIPGYDFRDIEVSYYTVYVGAIYPAHDYPAPQILVLDAIASPPALQGTYNPPSAAGEITLGLGLYLYASAGTTISNWGYIIDVFDPTHPTLVQGFDFPMWTQPEDLTYAAGYLYAFTQRGLLIYDVSPPASTSLVQNLNLDTAGNRGTLAGGMAYRASGSLGLKVLSLANPAQAELAGSRAPINGARRVMSVGDRVYASGERLWVVDLDDPARPQVSGDMTVAGYRTVATGQVLYMAGSEQGLVVMDISNPDAPLVLTRIPTSPLVDIRQAGGFLYVLESGQGLRIYDLDDPEDPAPRGFVAVPTQLSYLAVQGTYAYVADGTANLTVVDITNPDAPAVVQTHPGVFEEIEIANGRLYACAGDGGFRVYDLANPEIPSLIGSLPMPGTCRNLDVYGDFIHLANDTAGVSVVKVTDPANPVEIANHEVASGTSVCDVTAIGDVTVAGLTNGLAVFQMGGAAGAGFIAPPPAALSISAAPNPFSARTSLRIGSPAAGPLQLTLYDVTGRRIRTWNANALGNGAAEFTFNAADARGARLTAGVYFLKVESTAGSATQRLVVAR